MVGELPRTISVNGVDYDIRTDFRDILKILIAFNDPNLEDKEKVFVCLYIIYKDFDDIPQADYEEAFKAAVKFLDYNVEKDDHAHNPRTMDWEQDESIIFPAINKVAGFETRSAKYIHWWSFMGYYMEITEGVFSNVVTLRSKKARGKKLDKGEREFWNANKGICVLKAKLTEEEQAEKDRLNALLG